MTYTPKDFARDLLIELSHGYTPLRLAQWADNMLYRKMSETNAEIDRLLYNISCMSFGEEFYISEDELYDLAVSLIRPTKPTED